jgi:hypothetical protein
MSYEAGYTAICLPLPCMFSPSGYWQVKLERSYTRVSRFSRHPSAVKSAGSTAAGHVARLLSADDNLPSTFLSAGHEQAGHRAGLIAASGRVVALVPSRRTRRVVRQRPLAWRQASNPARPWLPAGGHHVSAAKWSQLRPVCRALPVISPVRWQPRGPWPGPKPGRPTVLTRSLRPTGYRFRVWSRNDTIRSAVCHRSDEGERCAHAERSA